MWEHAVLNCFALDQGAYNQHVTFSLGFSTQSQSCPVSFGSCLTSMQGGKAVNTKAQSHEGYLSAVCSQGMHYSRQYVGSWQSKQLETRALLTRGDCFIRCLKRVPHEIIAQLRSLDPATLCVNAPLNGRVVRSKWRIETEGAANAEIQRRQQTRSIWI